MNIYCGTDIIEVDRIQKAIKKHEKKFLNEIYSENEIKYCESKNNMKFQHYAARFAGKEAVFKAISKTLKSKYDLKWNDIEILNDINGRPFVKFINKDKCNNNNVQIDISLSHIKEYAIAYCVVKED